MTYKANVDDLRESPAIAVIERLLELGADVRAYDPYIKNNKSDFGFLTNKLSEACQGAVGLVLLVNHKEFQGLDPADLSQMMDGNFILDTRNILDREHWRAAGFKVKSLGDGTQG